MTRLSQIVHDYQDAGAMHALIPLCGFLDDGVFLTTGGDVGLVMALHGVDAECLDADQVETVTRRFETAVRLWDDHTRIYQYLLKQHDPIVPIPSLGGSPIDTLLARRDRFLGAHERDRYRVDLYVVILAEPQTEIASWWAHLCRVLRSPLAGLRDWWSPSRTIGRLDETLDRRRRQLRHTGEAFVLQLQETVRPRVLSSAEAFHFFRRLLNYDPAKADSVRLTPNAWLAYDVCDSALECHRSHLELDDTHVRVLTLKEPPAQTRPHLFRTLTAMPSTVVLVNEWQREEPGRMRRAIHAKQRHFHTTRVSLASYVTAGSTAPGDLLIDDSADALVRDLGAALTALTLQGRYFGQYTMTVVLFDTDPIALERSVAACLKACAAHDAQLTEERYNLLNAWLATIPGNTARNLRSMYLLDSNYADLSFLFAPDRGCPTNAHLQREALGVLKTTEDTAYHLNLHVGDVAHTLILGATGSGKSFFLNFLLAQLQRYRPLTLIFDLGGSYDALTRAMGGQTLRVALDRPGLTINPFCLPPTAANLQFLFTFLKVLIQADGQYAMTRADDQVLFEQIEALYHVDPDQRRLFTLASILPRPLPQQLHRWVEGGQYGTLFDHVEDTVTLAWWQTVDFEGLDRVPQVVEPLLFYLLHRASATVGDPQLGDTLKVFVLDEAWRFVRDPLIRAYLTDALKTWRKKKACLLLATQSCEDLAGSELPRVVIESCPTICFLANPQIDRAVYRDLFHLNETEAEAIATLVPRQQLLLKRPEVTKVLTLTVDPESAALFSGTRPGDADGEPVERHPHRAGARGGE